MSATNHTTTIELSQYVSTDKPTYLVDYNGDMLKIDNAIAADREGITDAYNLADTADGKADTNKESIDTLNEQINGDPEVPSDTGLAGTVNTIAGNVNTINSVIGNGSPTTSDQTIIGAINGLESAIAPREDSADLANSYAIGEQFARGGSVYTTLTSLTAGTAFASLTLNTDYKVADTIVKQIADANGHMGAMQYEWINGEICRVTADGVKTIAELLADLWVNLASALALMPDGVYCEITMAALSNFPYPLILAPIGAGFVFSNSTANPAVTFSTAYIANGGIDHYVYQQDNHAGMVSIKFADGATSGSDFDSVVPSDGATFIIYGSKYRAK